MECTDFIGIGRSTCHMETISRSHGVVIERRTLLPEDVINSPGPDGAMTFTIEQGSAIVYGAGVDNSGQGLTDRVAVERLNSEERRPCRRPARLGEQSGGKPPHSEGRYCLLGSSFGFT